MKEIGYTALNQKIEWRNLTTQRCLTTDLVCLSHLRWDFVFQRPQHLLTRFARYRRVFYIEEPVFKGGETARMEVSRRAGGLYVVVPHLPENINPKRVQMVVSQLIDSCIEEQSIEDFTLWYYTPMALEYSRHLKPKQIIYDCMDELSGFKGAPSNIGALEQELFDRADFVFTGGRSLYEVKKLKHAHAHLFPSSIDYDHFAKARHAPEDPPDQRHIPHPRLGFFGVLDERADLSLIERVADLKPEWHLVLIGPVVKIDPGTLPQRPNIHYLGKKTYNELPNYLAHWDVALLPFALNAATRFISPTKTPEYLAAGKPVVSTPVPDVVRPYGEEGLVHIALTAEQFVRQADLCLTQRKRDPLWLDRVDRFLRKNSWEKTWRKMASIEKRHSFERLMESSRQLSRNLFHA